MNIRKRPASGFEIARINLGTDFHLPPVGRVNLGSQPKLQPPPNTRRPARHSVPRNGYHPYIFEGCLWITFHCGWQTKPTKIGRPISNRGLLLYGNCPVEHLNLSLLEQASGGKLQLFGYGRGGRIEPIQPYRPRHAPKQHRPNTKHRHTASVDPDRQPSAGNRHASLSRPPAVNTEHLRVASEPRNTASARSPRRKTPGVEAIQRARAGTKSRASANRKGRDTA